MKTTAFLKFMTLGILGLPLISAYGPLQPYPFLGRAISHYNLIQQGISKEEFHRLESRFSYFEEVLKFFATQYSSIMSQLMAFNTTLIALNSTVPVPSCPPSATALGALMVYGRCLSVETSLKNYADAKTQCFLNGGLLAEPSYLDTAFYTNLNTFFPTKITALGTNGMYVGIATPTSGTAIYTYNSNGVPVPTTPPNTIWLGTVAPAINQAAFINTPFSTPTPWLTGGSAITQARGFICQYPVF